MQTREDKKLEKRFLEIKQASSQRIKSLPVQLNEDEVDEGIYYALFYLFLCFKYSVYSEEEYEDRCKKLLLKYKTRKSMRNRQFKLYEDEQNRYKSVSHIQNRLLKEELGYKEAFNLLFEFIGLLTTPVFAKRLKRKIGFLIAGYGRNLSDEEYKALIEEFNTVRSEAK